MVKMTFNNEKQTAFKKNPEGIFFKLINLFI